MTIGRQPSAAHDVIIKLPLQDAGEGEQETRNERRLASLVSLHIYPDTIASKGKQFVFNTLNLALSILQQQDLKFIYCPCL
jgi:hypothetical protein